MIHVALNIANGNEKQKQAISFWDPTSLVDKKFIRNLGIQ
jgi:hypothetical protein